MKDNNNTKKVPDETQEDKKLSAEMEKRLSPGRSLFKIAIAIFPFLWFLAVGSLRQFYLYLAAE